MKSLVVDGVEYVPADPSKDPLRKFVGKSLFIRTVTYHLVGTVEDVIGGMFELSHASWVADSGRFGAALATGKLSEVEYVGSAWVNVSAITDMFEWNHELPSSTK